MKKRKRPTLRQKKFIYSYGYDPKKWYVERNTSTELVIAHRFANVTRTLNKGA